MNGDILINNVERKNHKGVWIASVTTIVLIVVVAIIIIAMNLSAKKRYDKIVEVEGYDSLGLSISAEMKEDLGAQLYYLLKNHFDSVDDSGVIVGAIRPETANYTIEDSVEVVSFIVDIDEFEQTYNVTLSWSDSYEMDDGILIECTKKALSKYPQAKCYGMYTNSDSIGLYLPNELTLDSGEQIIMEYGYTNEDGKEIVDIEVNSCGVKTVDELALSKAKSWIRMQGLDAEAFLYRVKPLYENCITSGGDR